MHRGTINAVVKISPGSQGTRFAVPAGFAYPDLNTAAFDSHGILCFTGQAGVYGSATAPLPLKADRFVATRLPWRRFEEER
jgi:streptogramin lyase